MNESSLRRVRKIRKIYDSFRSVSRSELVSINYSIDKFAIDMNNLMEWTDEFSYRDLGETARFRKISYLKREIGHLNSLLMSATKRHSTNEKTLQILDHEMSLLTREKIKREHESLICELICAEGTKK